MAELLLSKGANVNAKTDKGHTPLHFAMEKNHKDVAKLLLQHGGKSK
jgi:ankyrin repeat protein